MGHVAPLGLGRFCYPVCYKHIAPLGLNEPCPFSRPVPRVFNLRAVKCQYALRYAEKKISTFVHADTHPRFDPDGC
ncbi:hypothetical protein J4G02_16810, partial [Candidatus Poribacteria bacterium]|nr:hypothetical protein [Candidatus Poribacteria bacterium]